MRSREGRHFALLCAALLLAACGSAPKPATAPPDETVAAPAKPAAKRPAPGGGGYYKDDGPADELPDGLDDIPDAVPRAEPLHRFANRPYVVFGKEYVPSGTIRPYRMRGIGSWYGKKFHGQKTSIGERYDMFAMTAAHPTLPLPSYARVTNLANGRSVIVRVNDRGPFHAGRIIDLSYAAAHRLDYIRSGSAQVEVEAIVPDATGIGYADVAGVPPRPPAAAAAEAEDKALAARLAVEERPVQSAAAIGLANGNAPGTVLLQLGAFANADNAENLRARLQRELDWAEGELRVHRSGGLHRLHLGPYANRAEAERVAERIREAHGFSPTFIVR